MNDDEPDFSELELSNDPNFVSKSGIKNFSNDDEFIFNRYYGKKMLTVKEAIDIINILSGVILIHECQK
jgi:hypothetical protein